MSGSKKVLKIKKRRLSLLLMILTIVNIVGIGFSSWSIEAGDNAYAHNEDAIEGNISASTSLSVDIISMFTYGPDGFASFENGAVVSGETSTTGTIVIQYEIDIQSFYSFYNAEKTTIRFKTTNTFNKDIFDFDIFNLTATTTCSFVSLIGVDEFDHSKDDLTNARFTNDDEESSTTKSEQIRVDNIYDPDGLINSTYKTLTFKYTHTFTYSGSDFYNDVYMNITNITNDETETSLTLKAEASVEGVA